MNTQTSPPPVLRPFASCHDHPMRRTCMLMVTHGCNLNCIYCYEKFKNGAKRMDVTLAKDIILKEINLVKNNDRFEGLEVDFMGGEPLLRFDLIKEVAEWLEQTCDIPFICFATTNATLLTDEMKDWFRQHKNTVCLGASYDGVGGDSQSINRGEAATKIDFNFFRELWPAQGFKMTISKASLPYLYESYVSAARAGWRIDASLAQGEDWNTMDATIYHEQLNKLKDFYLENTQYRPCNLLARPLPTLGANSDYQPRYCGSGVYMATYDTDGTLYGCHLFSPIVLGNRALKHSDFKEWENEQRLTDPDCRGCGFMQWCPTCMGFNYKDRGDVCRRDHRWCAMIAAQAMSACQFQIEYFARNTHENNMNEEEAAILKSALLAYGYLKTVDYTKAFPQ